MKFKRNKLICTAIVLALMSGVMGLGPKPTSVALDFTLFGMKLAVVLIAIAASTTDE